MDSKLPAQGVTSVRIPKPEAMFLKILTSKPMDFVQFQTYDRVVLWV